MLEDANAGIVDEDMLQEADARIVDEDRLEEVAEERQTEFESMVEGMIECGGKM